MEFRITYEDPAALLADWDQQLARGGYLVRQEPPSGVTLFQPSTLVLTCLGRELRLDGQVLQVFPGMGVAVSVSPGPELEALVQLARGTPAEARQPGDAAGPQEGDEVCGAGPQGGDREGGAGGPQDAHARVRSAGRTERIRLARYGNRDERMLLMRGTDPVLHRFVLNNPGLGLEEVRAIAGMTHVAADILKAIFDRAEWSHRPDVALALVRNPKTPVPLAIVLLGHVPLGELRQLAKSSSLRMPVLQAVRKRVVNA